MPARGRWPASTPQAAPISPHASASSSRMDSAVGGRARSAVAGSPVQLSSSAITCYVRVARFGLRATVSLTALRHGQAGAEDRVDRREQRCLRVDLDVARRDPLRAVRRRDRVDQLLAVERGRARPEERPRPDRLEVRDGRSRLGGRRSTRSSPGGSPSRPVRSGGRARRLRWRRRSGTFPRGRGRPSPRRSPADPAAGGSNEGAARREQGDDQQSDHGHHRPR